MTTNQHFRISNHAEQRRQERHIPAQAVRDAVSHGQPVRTATGWRFVGPDGTHVITDATGTVVVTVLGRVQRPAHDRMGAGRSRHCPDRPQTRTDHRRPRR